MVDYEQVASAAADTIRKVRRPPLPPSDPAPTHGPPCPAGSGGQHAGLPGRRLGLDDGPARVSHGGHPHPIGCRQRRYQGHGFLPQTAALFTPPPASPAPDSPEYVRQCVRTYVNDWTVLERKLMAQTTGRGRSVAEHAATLQTHEFQVPGR